MAAFASTQYFQHTRSRLDRRMIKDEWIDHVLHHPEKEEVQSDGRIRRWARIADFENRALRLILLEDGSTVHNAFSTGTMKRNHHEN